MKKLETQKGITLIVLSVTVIILLILAGVSISLLAGENGIFKRVSDSVDQNTIATAKEEVDLKIAEVAINYYDDVYVKKEYSINKTKGEYIEEKCSLGETNSGYEFAIQDGKVTIFCTDNNGLSSNIIGKLSSNGSVVWNDENTETLASKITATNYGDKVIYSANGITDWKIFYNDEENVYIISSDYVNHTTVTSKASFTSAEMTLTETYSAYWRPAPSSIQSGWDTYKNKYMMTNYNEEWETNSYGNFKAVSKLLATDNWTDFVNETYADWAIGGPTIEMYVASWNAKGYKTLYCNNTDGDGYFIGTNDTPTSSYINMNLDNGYNDTLYYPYKTEQSSCYGYWLASPSSGSRYDIMYVKYDGYLYYYDYNAAGYGVRPVVSLKSDVLGTSSTVDGVTTWNLSM